GANPLIDGGHHFQQGARSGTQVVPDPEPAVKPRRRERARRAPPARRSAIWPSSAEIECGIHPICVADTDATATKMVSTCGSAFLPTDHGAVVCGSRLGPVRAGGYDDDGFAVDSSAAQRVGGVVEPV